MSDPEANAEDAIPDQQYIWSLTVVNVCDPSSPRDLVYPAPYDFDKALAAGKQLLAKKYPNRFKDRWPQNWNPDLEIVGLKRGMELDDEREAEW